MSDRIKSIKLNNPTATPKKPIAERLTEFENKVNKEQESVVICSRKGRL